MTADGEAIAAHSVVNCMGPWFERLNRTAAVSTTTLMLPTRIQVGHKALPDDENLLSLPFVADSDVYFMPRRHNKQLVFGSVAHRFESEIVVRPDELNTALDPDVKADYLGCLAHRLPTLPMTGSIQGFSHMYTVNQDDVHPVVGPSKKYPNYFLCNGFSGHGFQVGPGDRVVAGAANTGRALRERPVPDHGAHGLPQPDEGAFDVGGKDTLCLNN